MQYLIENKNYQYVVRKYNKLTDIPHIHTHLEMIYLNEGRAQAAVDGKWYPIEEGDLFLSSSNQIHYYSQRTTVEIYLLIFDNAIDPLLQEFLKGKKPVNPVVSGKFLPADIRQQLDQIFSKEGSEQTCTKLEAKGKLLSFLGAVLPLFEYEEDTMASHDSVKNILQYCAEHYTETISLDIISKKLHLSKFYISHVFHLRMNTGFTEFINGLRIRHACELLNQGYTITETAFSSGFTSIRTFNRVFLKEIGKPPREYILQQKIESK